MTQSKQLSKTITLSKGFTLIELMIVIAIIGILIAVGIPSYKNYIKKAHYSEIIQAALPFKLAVEQCYQLYSNLSSCTSGKYSINDFVSTTPDTLIHSIKVSNGGVITVTPNSLYGITAQDTYILTPNAHQSRLLWTSSGNGVTNGYA